jgi:hypothetical protein
MSNIGPLRLLEDVPADALARDRLRNIAQFTVWPTDSVSKLETQRLRPGPAARLGEAPMKNHSGPADRPRLGQANLSVMKPAFNEERTLEIILGHVLERPEVGEVIVIDVGSTDQKMPMISSCAM